MANCPKCGAPNPADSQFCINCGSQISQPKSAEDVVNSINSTVDRVSNKLKNLNNTKDYTVQCDPNDANNNQVMGILAYIPLLFLIPYFAKKDSRFAQFHANQGLLVTIVFFGLGIAATIVDFIISLILTAPDIGFLNVVNGIICWLIGLASGAIFLYLMIVGILNACSRKIKDLPIIGAIRILK